MPTPKRAIDPNKKGTPLARGFQSLTMCGGASLTSYSNGVVSGLYRPATHAFLLFVIFVADPVFAFHEVNKSNTRAIAGGWLRDLTSADEIGLKV